MDVLTQDLKCKEFLTQQCSKGPPYFCVNVTCYYRVFDLSSYKKQSEANVGEVAFC